MVFLHSHGAIEAGDGEVQGLDEPEAEFLDSWGRNLLMIEPPGAFIDLDGLKRVPELILHSKLRKTRMKNILLLFFISGINGLNNLKFVYPLFFCSSEATLKFTSWFSRLLDKQLKFLGIKHISAKFYLDLPNNFKFHC